MVKLSIGKQQCNDYNDTIERKPSYYAKRVRAGTRAYAAPVALLVRGSALAATGSTRAMPKNELTNLITCLQTSPACADAHFFSCLGTDEGVLRVIGEGHPEQGISAQKLGVCGMTSFSSIDVGSAVRSKTSKAAALCRKTMWLHTARQPGRPSYQPGIDSGTAWRYRGRFSPPLLFNQVHPMSPLAIKRYRGSDGIRRWPLATVPGAN